jgi:hypothetical protein
VRLALPKCRPSCGCSRGHGIVSCTFQLPLLSLITQVVTFALASSYVARTVRICTATTPSLLPPPKSSMSASRDALIGSLCRHLCQAKIHHGNREVKEKGMPTVMRCLDTVKIFTKAHGWRKRCGGFLS